MSKMNAIIEVFDKEENPTKEQVRDNVYSAYIKLNDLLNDPKTRKFLKESYDDFDRMNKLATDVWEFWYDMIDDKE